MTRTVLIVEDDEMIREVMDVTLSQAGFRVATAANGETALDLLRRLRFDLVLMDVHMPRMSGLDVMQSMKRMGRIMPPVLMVSANRSLDTVNEALRLGCCGYVAKPFTPEGLVSRVHKALLARPVAQDAVIEI